MKKIITLIHSAYILLGALFLFSFIGFKASAAQIDITTDDFEPTSVLAIIRTGGEISLFSEFNNNSVLTKLDELGISEAENLDMSNSSEISLFSMGDRVNTYKLTLVEPGVENVKDTVARLNEMSDVIAAEPNYYVYLYDTPDDYYYKQNLQYGLDKISAPDVWNLKIDASDVAVAVVDSGVRTTHEDLKNNIWTNPGEIPDNGIDDDENGFIDDVHGWDFYNNDNVAEDVMGHGTHVAGIVSAQTNNSVGVASLARNAKIVPVKVFGNGTTTVDLICKGLNYIKKMGFPIANCSLGSMGGGAAMAKIMNECTNTVFACAAGNAEEDENGSYVTFNIDENPRYPAACDCENIISVASSDSNDNLSSFSNYGVENVDIAAPGTSIMSTYINGTSNKAYALSDGTSMATPYVASAIALMRKKFPYMMPANIIERIITTVDYSDGLNQKVKASGRFNAYNALAVKIESIDLNESYTMNTGDTLDLSDSIYPVDTDDFVLWTSDNEETATVENGVVTALKAGRATITARCGNIMDSCTIEVFSPIKNIQLHDAYMTAGGQLDLRDKLIPSYTTDTATWSSSNENVATMENGVITAVGIGRTTITVKCGGITDTCVITVVSVNYWPKKKTNQNVKATINIGETTYTHIFEENGEYTFEVEDYDGNKSYLVANVDWIDRDPPTAELVYSELNATNKDVTASLVNISEELSADSETSYIFLQNEKHNLIIKDLAGNEVSFEAEVNWIDKTPPTAKVVYSTTKPTNQNVTATLTELSEDVVEDVIREYIFTENRNYTFILTDKAGNITRIVALVDWIDKIAPDAQIQYSTTALTNSNVTANVINPTEELSDDSETEYIFTENGSYVFSISDICGNKKQISAKVDWIDKEAPLAEVKYSTTEKTQEPVTVWLENLSEEIMEKLDELRFTFEENGTHNFKITDMAGNESDVIAQVSWIEKPEPTPEPTPVPVKDYVEFARSGSIVEAKLIFEKTTPPPVSDISAYAVFKKDGIMKRAVLIKPTEDMKVSFIVGSEFEDCDIRLYIWDEDMKPLMEIQSFQ